MLSPFSPLLYAWLDDHLSPEAIPGPVQILRLLRQLSTLGAGGLSFRRQEFLLSMAAAAVGHWPAQLLAHSRFLSFPGTVSSGL